MRAIKLYGAAAPLFILGAFLAGCGGGGGGGSTAASVGSISGYVYASIGSIALGRQASAPAGAEPLQGATVTASNAGSTVTASDGSYSIGNIPAGKSYTITISKTGYQTLVFTKTIQPGNNVITSKDSSAGLLSLVDSAAVFVGSSPSGAGIAFDGKATGLTTPYTFTGVAPGDHTIALSLSGYTAPGSKTVTAVSDQTLSISPTLIANGATTGSIAGKLNFASPLGREAAGNLAFARRGAAKYDPRAKAAREAKRSLPMTPCTKKDFRPGQLLVRMHPGVEERQAEGLLYERGLSLRAFDPEGLALAILKDPGAGAEATAALCRDLQSAREFQSVDLNGVRTAARTPNDTHFASQWNLSAVSLPAAWDITTGSSDVIVAVIDSGILTHSDLTGKITAGYDFISDPVIANDGDGYDDDPTDDAFDPALNDQAPHGTEVASVIAALTNNAKGIAGTSWNAKIMPLRFLGKSSGDSSSGDDFDLIAAIKYAAGLANASGKLPVKKANIINMSLGGDLTSCQIQEAVDAARAAGLSIFAASGNSGGNVQEPAICNGVVAVGASNQSGVRASFSSYKPVGSAGVDLVAPGTSIYVAEIGSQFAETYDVTQGTSYSTPLVAGIAALMLSIDNQLTPSQIESLLVASADDVTESGVGTDQQTGAGIANAKSALDAVVGDPVLSLSTTAYDFGFLQTAQTVVAANSSSGALIVQDVYDVEDSGGNWLSVSAEQQADKTVDIDISVNRSILTDGLYTGTVTVESNGGTETIQVAASKASSMLVTVLKENSSAPGTFDTVAQVETTPTADFLYQIVNLAPASNYIVKAGTDLDDDGQACDSGEIWCGAWQNRSSPTAVSVSAGAIRDNISFSVDYLGN